MKPNVISLEDIISDEAINVLRNEMSLVYWRLNNMRAYEKAGAKFDEGDWGICLTIFSLGYMNGFIHRRLDERELPLLKPIYELTQSKYFRSGWGDDATNVLNLCWRKISESEENQMFYKMGQVASGIVGGIVKDVVLMFMTKYDLLNGG